MNDKDRLIAELTEDLERTLKAHDQVADSCKVFFVPVNELGEWMSHYRSPLQKAWDDPFLRGKMIYPQVVLKQIAKADRKREQMFIIERQLIGLRSQRCS